MCKKVICEILGKANIWIKLFLTSFCVTVSMMVPKAGMVDILTELKSAGEEGKNKQKSFRFKACVMALSGFSLF